MIENRKFLLLLCLFSISVIPYIAMYTFFTTSHLFLNDDAFYYFQIAQNLHEGYGSTFDRINLTNGYHPLWLGVISLFATPLLSKDLFITIVLLLQCAIVCAVWTFFYRLIFSDTSKKLLIIFLSFVVLFTWNYYFSKILINGMESALFFLFQILMIGFFSRWITDCQGINFKRAFWLALLASLSILSRLESVFYLGVLSIIWILKERNNLRIQIPKLALFITIPSTILIIYMIANKVVFGIWMPVSGYLKHTFFTSDPSTYSITGFIAFLIVIILSLRLLVGPFKSLFATVEGTALSSVSLYLIFFTADLAFFRGKLIPETWYLIPHITWFTLVCILAIKRFERIHFTWAKKSFYVIAVVLGISLVFISWRIRLQKVSYNHYLVAKQAAEWINNNLSPDTILAGWDVGIVGYYSRPSIINLDGLVNSYQYYEFLKKGQAVEFLDEFNVQYIVQYYNRGFENYKPFGYNLEKFRTRTNLVQWTESVKFASMENLQKTGKRELKHYEYQIRKYEIP